MNCRLAGVEPATFGSVAHDSSQKAVQLLGLRFPYSIHFAFFFKGLVRIWYGFGPWRTVLFTLHSMRRIRGIEQDGSKSDDRSGEMELRRRRPGMVPGARVKLIDSHGTFGESSDDIKFSAQGSDDLPQS